MGELYCIYQETAPDAPERFCGPANVKTRQGLALVAFPTRELAEYFASVFGVKGRIVPLSELASGALPIKPRPPVTAPRKMLVFATKGVLSAWADDRAGFDTAPHVSEFRPPKPKKSG